jgi:predicted ATPase
MLLALGRGLDALASPSKRQMINTLTVKNFKCFRELRLHDLKRINVIVGRNAGGKTALLEALFLLAAQNPQIVLKLRVFRGMGSEVHLSHERESFQTLWRDLFFGFDQTETIEIVATGSEENSRSLAISYTDAENVTLPFGTQAVGSEVPAAAISFRWTKASGESQLVQPMLTPTGLSFGASVEGFPAFFHTPAYREPPSENGKRFSELSKVGQEGPLIDAVRAEFPFVQDLSVEYESDTAMIHASLRAIGKKVPLPLVSDGVNKLVSILLAIERFSRGIVLIDEMENGLYFDIMAHVSNSILEFAKKCHTQLFLTTHSMEYLRSLLPLVEAHPDEFCLLRTTRDNGWSDVDQFEGRQLMSALSEGFEIR